MSQFHEIDTILVEWAEENSLQWYSEYQDTEVRTFFLNPGSRDRVQIAVDVPQGGKTVVHIGQLQRGLSRLARRVSTPVPVANLSSALDNALKTARDWLAESDSRPLRK